MNEIMKMYTFSQLVNQKFKNMYFIYSHERVIIVNLYINEIQMGSTYRKKLLMR